MGDEFEVDGVVELDAAVTRLVNAVEKGSQQVLSDFAADEEHRVQSAAQGHSRLARRVAQGVTGRKSGKGSQIIAGGSGRATSRASYGDLFFGAEFGGSRGSHAHFGPYRPSGYWFFPTIEDDIDDNLVDSAEELLGKAGREWEG